jgi:ABC-2 type transport system ATP-binding protein
LPQAVVFDTVGRRFGETQALDAVTLRIAAGETVALLGPNGAGKSTAIGIMLGLLEPSTGRASTLGMTPRQAVQSGRVGAMLQSAALPSGARVGELVELARGLYPAPSPRGAILDRAGLIALTGRRAETLSGGEAQRVRFAFAIAGDPDLVFLDEPTVAMDVEGRRAFWDDMRRFAAEGRTVLFATHYLDEADHVADRILVLDRGRIVGDGSPTTLKASVSERTIRFTWPEAAVGDDGRLRALPGVIGVDRRGDDVALLSRDADETVRGLFEAGIGFRHLEVAGADLDTAFLALTSGSASAA